MREAEVSLGESDLGAMRIEGLVATFREAGIRDVEELACRGNGGIVEVAVETEVDEDALAALSCVERWERVDGSKHRYVVEFGAPILPESLAEEMDELVGTCDPDLDDRGVTMSLVGTQDAIAGTVSAYESSGVSPSLERLGRYERREDPLDDLTDRQREVIGTAYDLGYYEVPREASTADVAAELDVDPSTVAEHLQRAERNLLRHHLE